MAGGKRKTKAKTKHPIENAHDSRSKAQLMTTKREVEVRIGAGSGKKKTRKENPAASKAQRET